MISLLKMIVAVEQYFSWLIRGKIKVERKMLPDSQMELLKVQHFQLTVASIWINVM